MAVFVIHKTQVKARWTLASLALSDAYTDFMLSRQAKQCSSATLEFYKYTAGAFLGWLEAQGVTSPDEVTGRYVRQYLAGLTGADTSKHDHARAIKTLLRFWFAEGYSPALVTFDMPRVAQKRLLCLTADEVSRVLKVCNVRDRALVLLMVDSGLRRGEVCALNWGDLDIASGVIRVQRGKGGKARTTVIGATARRALLAYRRTLEARSDDAPMFQAKGRTRFTGGGLMQVFRRISKVVGTTVTAHSLRRTFVILSLRAGMDVLHLQALLGHASLDMVQHYAQMIDGDLLEAHRVHSPIDNLARLK
jgi:site-specific recombinase XerD